MSVLVKNKKATFNYDVIEKYVAGVALLGFEVKSLKRGHGSLMGSFVVSKNGELFLKGAYIPPYQPNNTPAGYDPYRLRKLKLRSSEIKKLSEKKKSHGLTILPLSLYNKDHQIKLSLALARGKKKYDKRQSIKKRDQERDLGRRLKA